MKLALVASALILLSTAAVSSAYCNRQTEDTECGNHGGLNTFSCICVPKNSASLSTSAAEFVAVSNYYDSESPHTFEEYEHGYKEHGDVREYYEGEEVPILTMSTTQNL